MSTEPTAIDQESPARRLEVLYLASFGAVALLLTISLAFILWELSGQGDTMRLLNLSSRRRSLDWSLSLAALSIQAADDSQARREGVESLRRAVRQWERDSPESRRPGAAHRASSSTESEIERIFGRAEPGRRAAIRAARAVIDVFGREGTPRAGTEPLVRNVVAAEAAYLRTFDQAELQAERDAAGHIMRLKSLELKLFGFVLVVLLLEAVFVINPAVRKIRLLMKDMGRSHEELKSYAVKLERSNRELQDFASVAAHDLQEPLRKVQAFSDRLKSKYAASFDDQGRDYLERVQNAARRMQTLINDLLTYARVSTKAQPFVPTDLAEAARAVVSDLEVRIEQVKGHVEVGDLPTVDADPLQVRQLMQNLIGNALKYHRPEEAPRVKVYSRLAAEEGPSSASASQDGVCQILVEDNGIGFDEVYSERIFTIFQRLHGRNEYEGTGVGLAVCRKIADRHGGTITARSTPGKGSTFLVTLPVRQQKGAVSDGSNGEVDLDPGCRR
jgi:signal transduction histidine kinase